MLFGASGGGTGGVESYVGLAGIGAVLTALGVLARRFLSGVEKQKDNLLTPCYEQLAAKTEEVEKAGAEIEHNRRVIERLRTLLIDNGVKIPPDTWRRTDD